MTDLNSSLKDQGYTSPDFLTNLFRKPLYSPLSITTLQSQQSLHQQPSSPNKENLPTSLRSIDSFGAPFRSSNSHSKIYRSSSFIDQEKINGKKYKIFFKTFLHGRVSEEEINQIWEELEQSISNPYAFDRLIDRTKTKRQQQQEQEASKNHQPISAASSYPLKERRHHSSHKRQQLSSIRYSSPQIQRSVKPISTLESQFKVTQTQMTLRKAIRKDVKSIRNTLLQGTHMIMNRK